MSSLSFDGYEVGETASKATIDKTKELAKVKINS